MRAFEQLLEAVEYSLDINSDWTEQFSDAAEARSVLCKAEKQPLDEYDVARLSIAMGEEPPDMIEEVERIKKRCFSRLKRSLLRK